MNTQIPKHNSGRSAVLTSLNKATPCGPKPVASGTIPGATPLKPQARIPDKKTRSVTVKFRLTHDEYLALVKLLPTQSGRQRGLSRFLRERIFHPRRHSASPDPESIRLIARFNNYLDQIARQTYRIENHTTQMEMLSLLVRLDRELDWVAIRMGIKKTSS